MENLEYKYIKILTLYTKNNKVLENNQRIPNWGVYCTPNWGVYCIMLMDLQMAVHYQLRYNVVQSQSEFQPAFIFSKW